MKGFPQGIPEIAMPYLEAMQINPEDLMQQNPGAPEEAEDAAGQESAMEIGGPVMAQQPGAPLQYLQDGGPDYFAMGGLRKYQGNEGGSQVPAGLIPAAPPEMGGYKSNFPEGFYNYALTEREKLLKGNPEAWKSDPDMLLPDGSLNYCIDCVGNEEIYKNEQNVKDIARLIEEGYSTGTHRNQEVFNTALKKYGLETPQYSSKKAVSKKQFGGNIGYTEGDEVDMTEEEIADFIANGGELEYL
jgi:hypothetical protein